MIFGKGANQTFRSTEEEEGVYFQLPCFVWVKDDYRTFRCPYVCVLRCSLPAFVFRYLIPKSLEQAQRRHQTTQQAVLTVKVRMILSV